MTTNQKRNLSICTCVGLMTEYYDETKLTTKPKKAFATNLSPNPDKSSYASLQHLFQSMQQSPIKEILQNRRHTKLEICFDNDAPTHKS